MVSVESAVALWELQQLYTPLSNCPVDTYSCSTITTCFAHELDTDQKNLSGGL